MPAPQPLPLPTPPANPAAAPRPAASLAPSVLTQTSADARYARQNDVVQTSDILSTISEGLYCDGITAGYTVTGTRANALGYLSSTLYLPAISLPDWTPTADTILADQVDGNHGWRLVLTPTGHLRLDIGDGTAIDAHQFTATVPVPAGAYNPAQLTLVLVRSGDLTIYRNGAILGDAIDLTPADGVKLPVADLRILPSTVGWLRGRIHLEPGTAWSSLDAAAAASEPGWLARRPTGGNLILSDFSTDRDGWNGEITQSGGTSTPNVDSIGGLDDWYAANEGYGFGNCGLEYEFAANAQTPPPAGSRIHYRLQYYIPSGLTSVDRAAVIGRDVADQLHPNFPGNIVFADLDTVGTYQGSTQLSVPLTKFQVLARAGANGTWNGTGETVLYIRGVQIALEGAAISERVDV